MNHPPDSQQPGVALVLGSGGLKCAAALGVWQVLQSEGIPIRLVAGCSGGSLYAASIALGYSLEECLEATYQLWTPQVASRRHWPSLLSAVAPRFFPFQERFGLIDDRLIGERLRQVFGDLTFAHTKIPLRIAATDLHSGRSVALSSGRLADAVRASIAIPFVFAPWEVDGRLYIDGGVTNPVPVDMAAQAGPNAGPIVAVGLDEPARTQLPTAAHYALHLTDMLYRQLHQANLAFQAAVHHRDIVPIQVTFDEPIKLTDTHKLPQIIAAGERAARRQLPLLRQLQQQTPAPAGNAYRPGMNLTTGG